LSSNDEVKETSRKRTRRSFLVAGLGAVGGYEFYRWIQNSPRDQLLPRPLRRALNFNEELSRGVFDERGLSPTYPVGRSVDLRVNGNYGLKQDLLMESYRLQVVGVEEPKSFAQYVDDVTEWEYRYKAEETKYTGHDTKVAPKAEAGVDDAQMTPAFQKAFAEMHAAEAGRRKRGRAIQRSPRELRGCCSALRI